jgi:hypothetical protein
MHDQIVGSKMEFGGMAKPLAPIEGGEMTFGLGIQQGLMRHS